VKCGQKKIFIGLIRTNVLSVVGCYITNAQGQDVNAVHKNAKNVRQVTTPVINRGRFAEH